MQRLLLRFILSVTLACSAQATSNPCLKAIYTVAEPLGVSASLLQKIARTESGYGQDRQPWPWTINVRGKDYYFKDQASALTYIDQLLEAGIESFDVGCFQINWRWHRQKVKSPAELLHPLRNAVIAANYLQELYARHRSVYQAVAHYHSSHPLRGASYVQRVLAR